MFHCQSCQYNSKRKFNLHIHINNKHKRDPTDIEMSRRTIPQEENDAILSEDTQKSSLDAEKSSMDTERSSKITEKSSKITQKSSEITEKSSNFENKFQVCEKCKKTFKTLHGLKNHKTVCKGVANPLECHHCHCVLATKQSKSKHLKVCKIKAVQLQVQQVLETQQAQSLTNNTINNNNQQNIYIYQYRSPNDYCKYNYDDLLEKENVEHINDFGNENVSYITDDQMLEYASTHNFSDLIRKKHFNEEHPENHNIRSNCNKSYKVLKNKKWLAQPKERVFSTIYNNTKIELINIGLLKHYPTLNDDQQEVYLATVNNYDKKQRPDVYKDVDIQINELNKQKLKQLIHNPTANDTSTLAIC